ncbi:hypothetical protein EYB25_002633 [Talaromyces marneffei]|nr:hypothetical protein EYB25_002633 [Talaromyces marneffei]
MTGGSRSQKDYDFEYEGSLGKDQTPSNSEAHGSHDRLIPTSSEPLAGTIFDTPTSVADLSATEQYLIYSLRQLNLGGWASGDKSVLPLNKTEQEIIDLAFAMSATDQMTDFERCIISKVRTWNNTGIPPLSLATYAQRTFIDTIRDWRRSQKPESFIKRLFRK